MPITAEVRNLEGSSSKLINTADCSTGDQEHNPNDFGMCKFQETKSGNILDGISSSKSNRMQSLFRTSEQVKRVSS